MYTVRNPPVDHAPAAITAALAMHAGHIFVSSALQWDCGASTRWHISWCKCAEPFWRFCIPPAPVHCRSNALVGTRARLLLPCPIYTHIGICSSCDLELPSWVG